MTNITLSIPDEVYARMKMHREIRWSQVIRRSITEFVGKPEERSSETTTICLLEELGDDFRKSLRELSFEKAAKGYEKMLSGREFIRRKQSNRRIHRDD